jgi:hypothetical protein
MCHTKVARFKDKERLSQCGGAQRRFCRANQFMSADFHRQKLSTGYESLPLRR